MIIFICVCYYCLAIIGCFFRYYFSKFTREDFIYNKSLNRKRLYCIAYNYFVLAVNLFIYMLVDDGVIESAFIAWSTIFIGALYLFIEDPLSSRKKKRK